MVIGKVNNSILQPSDIYKEIWKISVRIDFIILRVFIQGNGLDKNLLDKKKPEFSNTVQPENYGKSNTTIVVVLLLYHLYKYGFALGLV